MSEHSESWINGEKAYKRWSYTRGKYPENPYDRYTQEESYCNWSMGFEDALGQEVYSEGPQCQK